MKRKIMDILGYGFEDRLYEASQDDALLDAYREMISDCKSTESLDDLIDCVTVFLDSVGDYDSGGEIEKAVVDALKQYLMSDGLKDQLRGMVGVLGESVASGRVKNLREASAKAAGMIDKLVKNLKLSHDFEEASKFLGDFVKSLDSMSPDASSMIQNEIMDAILDVVQSKEFVKVVSKNASGDAADEVGEPDEDAEEEAGEDADEEDSEEASEPDESDDDSSGDSSDDQGE